MTRDDLARRVLAFAEGSLRGAPPEPFEALCLDLHAWQAAHDPVIHSLAPDAVHAVADVPAVPVSLYGQLPVGTVKDDPPPVVFRTSGTTSGARGVHRLRSTDVYDTTARWWADRCVPDRPADTIALVPQAADSSLGHMVAHLTAGTLTPCWTPDGVDIATLQGAIEEARAPVWLATTAFALAEALSHPLPPLPEGSLVMVTGGFKGRTAALSDAELYARAAAVLAPRRIDTEYGMTELSSQLWGWTGEPYQPPPWLRVVAVDPATGGAVPRGEAGQLRFYDLANVDSSVGVETLDAGIVHGDGAVTLRGRLADAPLRGCSLTAEEAWARRSDG